MNFEALPPEMVANVLKHLDLSSLSKICQINKRCKNIVQTYMIDSVEFEEIRISLLDEKLITVESTVSDKRLPEKKARNWEYRVRWFANGEVPKLNVNEVFDDILSKASSVKRLVFINFAFLEETSQILLKHTKGEHGYGTGQLKCLEFRGSSSVDVSVDSFMQIIRSTELNAITAHIQCVIKRKEEILSNQVLMIKPINLSILSDRTFWTAMNMPNLNNDYLNFVLNNPKAELWIPDAKTSFTVTKVLEIIETIILNEDERFWHFGLCNRGGMSNDAINEHRTIANIQRNQDWRVRFDFLGEYYTYKIKRAEQDDYNPKGPPSGRIHFKIPVAM